MPNPQPDAREVARAREAIDTGFANGDEIALIVARHGAQRFAEGVQAGREGAAKIAVRWGRVGVPMKIAAAIRAGATT